MSRQPGELKNRADIAPVDDDAVHLAAESLMRNFGDEALLECAKIEDRWARRGDHQAAEIWQRVADGIRRLVELGLKVRK